MQLRLAPKNTQSLLPTDILFQTGYWAQVKSRLGCKPMAFDILTPGSKGDMLVLIQPFGEHGLAAYVPQGPECGPSPEDRGPYLENLSEALKRHLDPAVAFIRYDLPWESPYAPEMREKQWSAFPEPRIREMRMNIGTRTWNLRKAEMDMTVASSLVVNIEGPEERILSAMKPKTRYNIGLAGRKGVRVSIASMEELPAFYDLYCQTALRNGFPTCDYRHFLALFQAHTQNPITSDLVFLLAGHGSDILAGAIVAVSGKNAIFLHGASSTKNRRLMGSHALHWAAIRHVRALGCTRYDMGAVSPGLSPDHPFYGLYRFKTGFGGKIELRSGSWDFPLNEEVYNAFRNADILSRGNF
ncbi:Lipid II:glycine glycyltransferase (Peptidoglycan interpeptide bridge formation enzyme) [Desulfonatronum thiosulfatophilum]|uniref:Lipid II:glycine glycyltransferase (Peptidoglycan interpeptide bridge formation enzyme) n=1 Tax=Desulfonatronum thiosulfatophilum TaxID=617002 RepID=A0A1G6CVX5_9BACT|nr:peptidoglycan bridge formation glycyltransferase FemA/FemB family protein [Desulfonatronum thiosulfatophilum]SDB37093.1 Lipid II:glycine glycyltransferase (Peptidoglycan interpeptide bridge formation enzyme) [Desulfonatronum thiosulfatophilum]